MEDARDALDLADRQHERPVRDVVAVPDAPLDCRLRLRAQPERRMGLLVRPWPDVRRVEGVELSLVRDAARTAPDSLQDVERFGKPFPRVVERDSEPLELVLV